MSDLFKSTFVCKEIYDEDDNKGKGKLRMTGASCENITRYK